MKVSRDNFESFISGSYFLSAGGGFESRSASLFVRHQLSEKFLSFLPVASIVNDGAVLPISFLGCTTIETEKNYNTIKFERLMQAVQKSKKAEIAAILPISIGGGVPFVSIFLSSSFNIPLLDADLTGRCFPELQMLSTNLAGILPKKAFIANLMGDVIEIECCNFHALERHARQIAVSSGGACLVVPQVLTGEEAKRGLIAGSLTKALTIGQIIQDTQDLGTEEACGMITEHTKGKFVGVGGVVRSSGLNLPAPFSRHIVIKNAQEDRTWEIWMENEFNLLFENGELIAEVPDIITLCDVWTREPLTINQLRLNENVAILTTPAPDIWYTERGLALVRTQDHQDGKIAICGPSLSVLKKIA